MSIVERIFGVPMAAPETDEMRRLRFSFTVLVTTFALGILVIGPLARLLGRAGAGGVLLAIGVLTAGVGIVFFQRKVRRDDRWLEERGVDREGDAQ